MRHVLVAAERLQHWADGFADRHGPFELSQPDPEALALTAADGATARFGLPWVPGPVPGRLSEFSAHAQRPRRAGVLLVRRGGYAAGVFEGTELVSSKVGTAYVQSRTAAGGRSQHRFARRRDNQAAALYAAAADVAAHILLPWVGAREPRPLEVFVRGGDGPGVRATLADPRLAPLAALPSGPLLDVPDPRLVVLRGTPAKFRAVRIDLEP
jgi:hypothetical protein